MTDHTHPDSADNAPRRRIAVIGAGPVGRAVVERLVADGDRPLVLTRSGTQLPGADALAVDMSDTAAAAAALAGVSVAIQCAQPEYHRWAEEFRPFQTSVLDACAAAGSALVATENTYGYGPVDTPMTDGMPMRPTTKKGRVRAEMTQDLLDANTSGRVRTAAVRASDFFGPSVAGSAFGDRFFEAIVAGRRTEVLGDPHALHSVTYVPDLAAALVRVAKDPSSWGRAWHAPTAPAVTQTELVRLAADAAGTDPAIRVVRAWQLHLLGMFVKPVKEMIELRYEFDEDFVVDSSEFERRFSVAPTPLTESLAATVAWFRHGAAPQLVAGERTAP